MPGPIPNPAKPPNSPSSNAVWRSPSPSGSYSYAQSFGYFRNQEESWYYAQVQPDITVKELADILRMLNRDNCEHLTLVCWGLMLDFERVDLENKDSNQIARAIKDHYAYHGFNKA